MNLIALSYFEGFGNVLVFALFGGLFVFLNLFVIGKLIMRRPSKPDWGQKGETFECGEPTMGDSWIRFDIRFYTLDVDLPDLRHRDRHPLPLGGSVYEEFISGGRTGSTPSARCSSSSGILTLGLAYDWMRKDLEWTSTRPGRGRLRRGHEGRRRGGARPAYRRDRQRRNPPHERRSQDAPRPAGPPAAARSASTLKSSRRSCSPRRSG